VRVTLDIFSGRPNPSWELSQSQNYEFLKQISKLESGANLQFDSSKYSLGYRGFIVEEERTSFVRRVEAYQGIVKVVENDSTYTLEDKEYSIEMWLLQTTPQGLSDIVKYVKQELVKD
jgi:hypothetical protein